MRSLAHDLRFASRMLRKSPGSTLAAGVSLALGIGVNTALFTLLHGVFLRPLPVADLDRIVSFYTHQEQQEEVIPRISYPNFEDVAAHASAFGELAAIAFAPAVWLPGEGDPEPLNGQAVTSSFFPLLGVEAELGRTFLPEEDDPPGAHPVVVLNHHTWTTRFGADPGVVGRSLDLSGRAFTVVGVMPPGFDGTLMTVRPAFWVPLSMLDPFVPPAQRGWLENRRALVARAYGKLAPGVSLARARSEVAGLGRGLAEEHPEANGDRRLDVVPLAEAVLDPEQRQGFARAGALLAVAVGLVLLVACGNVANLLLARAAARRREIAVRLALGAPRSRLVAQLLTESLLLALLAGALGLLLALATRSALWSLRPVELADLHLDLSLDPPVLGFALALSVATGLLFGLAPALQASRPELLDDLKRESPRAPDAGGLFSLRNLLVMVQVALCLTALVFSGLALRGLGRASEVDLGFDPEGLASLRLELSRRGLDPARGEQLFDRALELARAVPGVEAATLAAGLPLSGGALGRTVLVEGRDPEAPNNSLLVPVNAVEPGFFRALGIPLVEGRDLGPEDRRDGAPVAVVNRAAARLLWPEEGALGRRFELFGAPEVREVVGVVADAKLEAVGEEPQPQVFLPRRQVYLPDLWLVVRAGGDPARALATVRDEIRRLDPALPVSQVSTLGARVAESLGGARLATALLGLLGALALVLASVGVYGVAAYSTQQRRSEIGIRMALGAERGAVLGMVLRQGMSVVGLGLAAGLLLAGPGARLLEGLLFGLSPIDPATFAATVLLLAGVALVANLIPAARATGVSPVGALRSHPPRSLALLAAAAAAAALPGLAVLGAGGGPFHPSAARTAGGGPAAPELLGGSQACARCHPRETAEWQASAHRHSGLDNPWYRAAFEEARREAGDGAARWCAGCHTPGLLLAGRLSEAGGAPAPAAAELAADPLATEGVSCVVCHASRVGETVGQGAYELDPPGSHGLAVSGGALRRSLHGLRLRLGPGAHRRAYSGHRQRSELCAACHKGHVDESVGGGRFLPLHNDYDPWQGSSYSGQGTVRSVHFPEPDGCAGCHMRPAGEAASHRFAAANTALPALRGDAAQLAAVEASLTSGWVSLDLFAMTPGRAPLPPGEEPPVDRVEPVLAPLDRIPATVRRGESIRLDLVVRPHGVGHLFPGGKADLHDLWVELEAVDGDGRTVFRSGGAEAAGGGAHVYRTVWVDGGGERVDHHRAWRARAAVYERRIEPTGAEVVRFRLDLPADAADPIAVTARLRHRKFPPELTRWAFESLGREAPPRLPVVTLAEARATLRVVDAGAPLPDLGSPALELPGDAERWSHYGVGLALQGDLRAAEEAFRAVVALAPEDPEAWTTLGRLQVVAGRFEDGRRALERALELAPGLARARHFLGLAARNEADLDGALAHFRAAAERYPRDPLILRQLATTELQKGDLAAAAATLEALLAIDPQDPLAHFNLTKAALGLGDPDRSARHQELFERFQVDETAQQHVLRYLADHPEDNLERQRIHEHRSAPLDEPEAGREAGGAP